MGQQTVESREERAGEKVETSPLTPLPQGEGRGGRLRVTLAGEVRGREAGRRRYAVVAITAGQGNGLEYSAAVLRQAVPLFEGVSVFVDHAGMGELYGMSGNRSLRNVLGVLQNCYFDEGAGGVAAVLRVYRCPDAEWFCAMVDQHLADVAEGEPSPRIGLSAVLDVEAKGREVQRIVRVVSVDAVFDPARGGRFIRALNARDAIAEGGQQMTELEPEYKANGGAGLEPARTEPARTEPARTEPARTGGGERLGGAKQQQVGTEASEADKSGGAAERSMPAGESAVVPAVAVALSEHLLSLRLASSGLPEPMRALLQGRYGGRMYAPAELDRDIEAMKAAWAQSLATAGPQVSGVPARGYTVGLSEVDRLQAVMDQLCGLRPRSELLQGIRPVSGIRELYLMLSGDYDFCGGFDAERVALANVTSATMTSLVKNAFNKVILDYFNTLNRWWEPIVTQENFSTMKDVTLITVGGFADLATVAEGDPYVEVSWSDEEEVASFVKKGNYVGVTLEMMDKDETNAFRAIPRKLAIAGYRTLSTLISNLWTANSGVGPYWPSSQSTHRLFSAQYGNLGTSALSASAWDAVIQAMYKQTEATSSKRMGIRPSYLVVPIELEKTALTILESVGEPGTADNDANVRRGSSRVIVCPDMTDANDWLAVADPRVWPSIMVGYRFGSTPEVFVAGEETVGSMFTHDEMRIKARFIVCVGCGEPKALYKNNVS